MKPFIRFELRFSLLSKCSHFLEYIYIMRRAIFADDKVGQIYRALSHVAVTGQCNKYEQRLAKAQILCKMQSSNLKRSQTRKSASALAPTVAQARAAAQAQMRWQMTNESKQINFNCNWVCAAREYWQHGAEKYAMQNVGNAPFWATLQITEHNGTGHKHKA